MADEGDRGLCHACGGVWLLETRQDGHDDLKCPHCESEFTEIIEIPPESPQSEPEPEPQPGPQSQGFNPWADHNPWGPEESVPRGWMESGSPGYSHRSYRSPDGRFTFSSTTIGGGYSSRRAAQPGEALPPLMATLDDFFQSMRMNYTDDETHRTPGMNMPPYSHATGMRESDVMHGGFQPRDGGAGRPQQFPRDPNVLQQLQSFTSFLEALEGTRETQGGTTGHGAHIPPAGASPFGLSPFAMLSAILDFNRNGDAVYSQEELDRVISQMIDNAQQGTAPAPAPETAIRSLPKKKMTTEMMGSDGKAECSICIEAVELDTEVTVLPCKHWFHFDCIKAWLGQHNTCPHCRRSIDSTSVTSPGEGTSENPVAVPDSPENSSSQRRRRRSSAFTSRSIRSARSSMSRSSRTSPTPEMGESGVRRGSQGESSHGGLTGWVWSRFGGSSS